MAGCRSQGWRAGIRLSKGVRTLLAQRPAFLLVLSEVCRRHERDWPRSFATVHRTVFERADLPGGGLLLRTTCRRGEPASWLSFIGGSLT